MKTARVREDKPAWASVPARVRERLERLLGDRVVRAARAYGGYGPSATFRVALENGRSAFVKGTYPPPPGSAVVWNLDRESEVYRRAGRFLTPWAPAYLGEIRRDGWHLVALEDVRGETVPPWTSDRTRRAAVSYAEFHCSTHGRRLPAFLSRTQHRAFGVWWRRMAREDDGYARLATLAGPEKAAAARWLRRAGPELRRAECALARVREPFVLMHFDTRSDNVRLQGRLLRLFDWPFASVGPHEFDLAAFAQSVTAEGGPLPEDVVRWYADVLLVRGSALRASVAGIAGYFADRAPRPPLAGLPRLRSIQRRQLKASLAWAARLLELPDPIWLDTVPD